MERRTFLGGVLATSVCGISGCSMLSDDDSADEPPVVDNSSNKPERNLRVEVTVLDEDGNPAGDTQVALLDGNKKRTGRTDADGRITFIESVGPAPCNRISLRAPEHGVTRSVGCHNGDKTIEETLEVVTEENETDDSSILGNDSGETTVAMDDPEETTVAIDDFGGEPPVVDDGSSKEERNVRVEVTVLNGAGERAANTTVRLNNKENDDPMAGRTDEQGRLVFIDSVGPAPCNDMELSVPALDISEPIGCHNGPKTIQETVSP